MCCAIDGNNHNYDVEGVCAHCGNRDGKKREPLPCPHGRLPIDGKDGFTHCPHCLGLNELEIKMF